MIRISEIFSDGVKGFRLCIHFTERHFSEFLPTIFPSFDQSASCAVLIKEKSNEVLVTSPGSSVAPAAVIAESPSVIVVLEARKPQAKPGREYSQGENIHIQELIEFLINKFLSLKSNRLTSSNAVLCSCMNPEKRNQLHKFLEPETRPASELLESIQ